MWHGFSQGLGDKFAGSKGDVDAAEQDFVTKLEVYTGGEWVTTREGVGQRPSFIHEAIKRALEAKGETVDDDRMKGIREKVKTAEQRKEAMANPLIKAQYEAVRAEEQAKRLEAANKAAAASEATLDF